MESGADPQVRARPPGPAGLAPSNRPAKTNPIDIALESRNNTI
jgi:hypothetical protein